MCWNEFTIYTIEEMVDEVKAAEGVVASFYFGGRARADLNLAMLWPTCVFESPRPRTQGMG